MKKLSFVGSLALLAFSTGIAAAQQIDFKNISEQISRLQKDVANLKSTRDNNTADNNQNTLPLALEKQLSDLLSSVPEFKKAFDLKGIYGDDDRLNHYRVTDIEQRAARSTLVAVRTMALQPAMNGNFDLPSRGAGLCRPEQIAQINAQRGTSYLNETFYDEPAPGFCTGVKVADDVIATAGHCVKSDSDCASITFVFGFFKTSSSAKPHIGIASNRLFRCKSLIKRVFDPTTKADWALVRVERPLSGVEQVQITQGRALAKGDGVTVVGYPMGLPVKIAGNAQVRRAENTYFVTNLDTYGGNSGSPVFNSAKLLSDMLVLEGLLVRGEDDFEVESPCRISKRCAEEGCRGEDVVSIGQFRSSIPGQ